PGFLAVLSRHRAAFAGAHGQRRIVPVPHQPEEAMSLGTLDRRTLLMLLGGLVAIAILRFGVFGDRQPAVVAPGDSIPLAERRLARLREVAATVPGKEAVLKQARADLDSREKGMLKADTVPQAEALLQ